MDTTRVSAKLSGCTKSSMNAWKRTFPCVLTRGSVHTKCRRRLPHGTDTVTWTLSTRELVLPYLWTGAFASESPIRNMTYIPFTGHPTCEGLGRLAVARSAQYTGVYKGIGQLTCTTKRGSFELQLSGPGVHTVLIVYTHMDNTSRFGFSSYAFYADRYNVLDLYTMSLSMRPVVSETTRNVSWEAGFDALNHFIVSMDSEDVGYSKSDLSAETMRFAGTLHGVVLLTYTGEPRLCPLSTLVGACCVMYSTAANERNALGEIKGFNLHTFHPYKGNVSISGYLLGTKGISKVSYVANGNPDNRGWLELPLDVWSTWNTCKPRMYNISQCPSLPDNRVPWTRPCYTIENATQYIFP